MPERAHVTSVEALDTFRSSLIIYLTKARPTLEEVAGDVLRTRLWLENDQRTHWENEIRRRTKKLEAAEQALFGVRLSSLREATDAEQLAVQRARRALDEAEVKLRRVKQWSREFDSRIEVLVKQLDHLRNLLTIDLPKAAAFLAQTIKTLSEYAGITTTDDLAGLSQQGTQRPAGDQAANPGAAGGGSASPAPQGTGSSTGGTP
jgi:hypothetical protein